MASSDLSVRILEEIRDELRAMREEQQAFARSATKRFEVIETTLRDLAQQLVMQGRALKVAIQQRGRTREHIENHEERIAALEKARRPPRQRRPSK